MGRTPEFDGLDEALRRLGASIAALGSDGSGKQTALEDIFRVNQEIGRLARAFRQMTPALRELQLKVNATTVLVKGNRPAEALQAFTDVTSGVAQVKANRGAAAGER